MASPRTDSQGRYRTRSSFTYTGHFIIPDIVFGGVPEFEIGGNIFTFTEIGKFAYDSALLRYPSKSRELAIIERFWIKLIAVTNRFRESNSYTLSRDPLLYSFYQAERSLLTHLINDLWYVFHIHFKWCSSSEEITLGRSFRLQLLNDYVCETQTGKDLRRRLRRFIL